MEIKNRNEISLSWRAYENYTKENKYIEYIDLHNIALNVVLEGKLLREYNDKMVFKLENNKSYILVTLTRGKTITNIIIHNGGEIDG